MNKTTENFLEALRNYTPPKTIPVVWKLVYNKTTGIPIKTTTEPLDQLEDDVSYIEITRKIADQHPHLNPRIRVKNNEIIELSPRETIKTDEPKRITVYSSDNGNIITDDYSMLIINHNGNNKWSHQ